MLNTGRYADIAFEEFDNAQDLLAAILAKGIANQVKRGLGREYIAAEEALGSPHGKIDITATLKGMQHVQRKLVCVYDEFSENAYCNQVLKTTALVLITSPDVARKQKDALKKVMLYFSDVDALNTHFIRWNGLRYHKNNATYKMLMNICYLVLQYMLPTTQDGKHRFSPLSDGHLCRLYEKFVLEYYRKHYPNLHARPTTIAWDSDDGAIDLLPSMKTDVTLTKGDSILIIDTKFYGHTLQTHSLYDKKSIHSGNLYQIYSYVKNMDTTRSGKISGALLYAKTDETITPDGKYSFGGNQFVVTTLNLDCDFVSIQQGLDNLIEKWRA